MDRGFDLETLADKTVEMFSISPGQVFWIWASTHSLDFVEALAFRIREQGAFWTLRLIMEPLLRRIGQYVPEPYLASIPHHELRWLNDIDAIIEVHDHGGHIPDVSLRRRRAMASDWIALIDEVARKNIHRVIVTNPTPALAAAYDMSLAQLRQAYWQAINIDYTILDKRQKQMKKRCTEARQVHITSAIGTDIHLQIDQRPIHLDENDLPRGGVYVAPLEDSAQGIVVVDKVFINGNPFERLCLTFAKGRVVKVESQDSEAVAAFRELLSVSSGDKDVIAKFAIGLNPGVTEPTGDSMLDSTIEGSVQIAIGKNEHFGGVNRSNLHLDLIMLHPTVWLDNSQIINDGIFL